MTADLRPMTGHDSMKCLLSSQGRWRGRPGRRQARQMPHAQVCDSGFMVKNAASPGRELPEAPRARTEAEISSSLPASLPPALCPGCPSLGLSHVALHSPWLLVMAA